MKDDLGRTVEILQAITGMSVKEMSDKAGLSYASVSKLRSGKSKNPTFKTIKCIADAFEMDVTSVMTFADKVDALYQEEKNNE